MKQDNYTEFIGLALEYPNPLVFKEDAYCLNI